MLRRTDRTALRRAPTGRGVVVVAAAVIVAALWAPSAAASKAVSTYRVSVSTAGVPANGNSFAGSVSATGEFAAFSSNASNLVPGDTNHTADVFVRDHRRGRLLRISLSSAGVQANGRSEQPSMSASGRYVAFTSAATNLVAGDTNASLDVFIRDRLANTTRRVSVATGGAQANGSSSNPQISADGQFVVYTSDATNLVPGDTNGVQDAFIWSRATGTTTRVSVSSTGVQADKTTWDAHVSGHGNFVAFTSSATNLVAHDTNAAMDAFLWSRNSGAVRRIDLSPRGAQATRGGVAEAISANGDYALIVSVSANLVKGDRNGHGDAFVWIRATGRLQLVTRATNGSEQNGDVYAAAISSHGRYVAFVSDATNLAPGAANRTQQVYLRDRRAGKTTSLVSRTAGGALANGPSARPALSDGARWVLFDSQATNLVPGDTNHSQDVFMRGPLW